MLGNPHRSVSAAETLVHLSRGMKGPPLIKNELYSGTSQGALPITDLPPGTNNGKQTQGGGGTCLGSLVPF